jgi:hypothetical protein
LEAEIALLAKLEVRVSQERNAVLSLMQFMSFVQVHGTVNCGKAVNCWKNENFGVSTPKRRVFQSAKGESALSFFSGRASQNISIKKTLTSALHCLQFSRIHLK